MQEFLKMTPEQIVNYASGQSLGFATSGEGHALKLALDLKILQQSTRNAKSVTDALDAFRDSMDTSSKRMVTLTQWITIATVLYAASTLGPVLISIYRWLVTR